MQDLLSIHLIRNVNGSTIFSYHPTLNLPTTTASFFHTRIRFAGQLELEFIPVLLTLVLSFRSECILANYIPTFSWSDFHLSHIYLARFVCLGWGRREFVWPHLLSCKSHFLFSNTLLTQITTGDPSDGYHWHSTHAWTTCHPCSPTSLYLPSRRLRATYEFHHGVEQPYVGQSQVHWRGSKV